MATTTADNIQIIGGVDTHQDLHTAAVVSHDGTVLGTESFSTTRAGYPSAARSRMASKASRRSAQGKTHDRVPEGGPATAAHPHRDHRLRQETVCEFVGLGWKSDLGLHVG